MKQHRTHPLGIPDFESSSPGGIDIKAGVTAIERWLVKRLARHLGSPRLAIALWDGHNAYQPPGESVGRIVFGSRRALWSVVRWPELGFGDAYSAGSVDIQGDLVQVLFELYASMEERGTFSKRNFYGRLPKAASNTLGGSKSHIHHHYDLGNDFYRLWLDEQMVYTCAYYSHPDATLEQAQIAKMDHVARKLRLRPGMEVVEAGCGWGALAMHLAEHYGVKMRAFNISVEQLAYAREQAEARGLSRRVTFVEDDYRNIQGHYDAFVSVGMLEHVGVNNYEALGAVAKRVMKADALGLIHSVGRLKPAAPNQWLERRIFPGSYPPSLREMMDIFEPSRFSILDVENLRLHYAKTLMEWLHRFDGHQEEIARMYDEEFIRAWRLYLAGCAASFMSSGIQLYQVVFSNPIHNRIPYTREHLYSAHEDTSLWEFN